MNDFPCYNTSQKSAKQLFRYGLIGIASNLAGYMIYLLITYLGATPKISMSLLYGVGAVVGFWGNRKITFAHHGSRLGAGVRYTIAHGIGYFINLAILVMMVDRLGYAHQWVQAIAIFIVAAFLFLAFKFFVFGTSDFLDARE
jgi:putative flippase GtrA